MNWLSSQGLFSVNATLLKDIKVNNEYFTLEFYYIEDDPLCFLMHFAKLEDAYTSMKWFKEKLIQAQLERESD